jgi:hypothetical protein
MSSRRRPDAGQAPLPPPPACRALALRAAARPAHPPPPLPPRPAPQSWMHSRMRSRCAAMLTSLEAAREAPPRQPGARRNASGRYMSQASEAAVKTPPQPSHPRFRRSSAEVRAEEEARAEEVRREEAQREEARRALLQQQYSWAAPT